MTDLLAEADTTLTALPCRGDLSIQPDDASPSQMQNDAVQHLRDSEEDPVLA